MGMGWDAIPEKDFAFFPLGVEDGERGRFDPEDEVDINKQKGGTKRPD